MPDLNTSTFSISSSSNSLLNLWVNCSNRSSLPSGRRSMFTRQLGFIDVREICSPLRTATASRAARAESTLPVAETLVGTRRRGFRSDALHIIREDPNHPLKFLLDKTGTRFKSHRTQTICYTIFHPEWIIFSILSLGYNVMSNLIHIPLGPLFGSIIVHKRSSLFRIFQ